MATVSHTLGKSPLVTVILTSSPVLQFDIFGFSATINHSANKLSVGRNRHFIRVSNAFFNRKALCALLFGSYSTI